MPVTSGEGAPAGDPCSFTLLEARKEMAEFDAWADYYDLLHPGLPGEAEFYVGQAAKRRGPVLEIGCGTGRIAIPIAMCGINVTGLDNSVPMLDVCREKAKAVRVKRNRLSLVEADMRGFELEAAFPLAIMAYRTFMHCLTPEDQRACLACIYNHLEPGGELICSLWAARPATIVQFNLCEEDAVEVQAACIPVSSEDLSLLHFIRTWRDDFNQRLSESHRVQEVDAAGTVLHEEILTMERAWITPREMEHLLARTGFETLAVLGDFRGALLGPQHTEMIWHVRRPH